MFFPSWPFLRYREVRAWTPQAPKNFRRRALVLCGPRANPQPLARGRSSSYRLSTSIWSAPTWNSYGTLRISDRTGKASRSSCMNGTASPAPC